MQICRRVGNDVADVVARAMAATAMRMMRRRRLCMASVDLGEPQHGSIETVALLTPLNGWSKTFIIRLLRIYYNNRS